MNDDLKIGGEPEPEAVEPATSPKQAPKAAKKKAAVKKTKIILQKNDDIPPSGLFIGHNGTGYQLKPSKAVEVPDFLLDVLDNAVVKKPVMGENGLISRYEDSPRFPYTVVRDKS
jgi:hypothetical protein